MNIEWKSVPCKNKEMRKCCRIGFVYFDARIHHQHVCVITRKENETEQKLKQLTRRKL